MAGTNRDNGDALSRTLAEGHDFPELRAVAQGIVRRALAATESQAAAAKLLGIGQVTLCQWLQRWPELRPGYEKPARGKKRQA